MKAKPDLPWAVERQAANIFRIKANFQRNKDWRFTALLSSDHHFDSPNCDRDMVRRHLEEAKRIGAVVLCCGDFFDVMGSKVDKRHSKGGIRPEYLGDNYFQPISEDAIEFMKPYAQNILFIGGGNHEDAITKFHEINFIDLFLGGLNHECGTNVANGDYSGFVRFLFQDGVKRREVLLYYEHGAGGENPGNKGMVKRQKIGSWVPQADIVMMGHSHYQWYDPSPTRLWCPQSGPMQEREQTHIQIPSYAKRSRWETRNQMTPKTKGAWWLDFSYEAATDSIIWDVRRAR